MFYIGIDGLPSSLLLSRQRRPGITEKLPPNEVGTFLGEKGHGGIMTIPKKKPDSHRPHRLDGAPLDYAPENELGVVFLFSTLAKKQFGLRSRA